MIALRPFRKIDWYGYGGAESFPDGSEPLIGSIDLVVSGYPFEGDVILDANGVGIYAFRVEVEPGSKYSVESGPLEDEDPPDVGPDQFIAWFSGAEATRALAGLKDGVTDIELRAMPGFEEGEV